MYVNRDIYGDYKECLYCGMMIDIEKESGILTATVAKAKAKPKKSRKAA